MSRKGKKLNGPRWAELLTRRLPDRELILRTDVKMRFLKISHKTQLTALGLIILLSGWGIFSSFSYFINDKIIEAKDNEILNAVPRGQKRNASAKFAVGGIQTDVIQTAAR